MPGEPYLIQMEVYANWVLSESPWWRGIVNSFGVYSENECFSRVDSGGGSPYYLLETAETSFSSDDTYVVDAVVYDWESSPQSMTGYRNGTKVFQDTENHFVLPDEGYEDSVINIKMYGEVEIAEILIFEEALTQEEIQAWVTELQTKYGI